MTAFIGIAHNSLCAKYPTRQRSVAFRLPQMFLVTGKGAYTAKINPFSYVDSKQKQLESNLRPIVDNAVLSYKVCAYYNTPSSIRILCILCFICSRNRICLDPSYRIGRFWRIYGKHNIRRFIWTQVTRQNVRQRNTLDLPYLPNVLSRIPRWTTGSARDAISIPKIQPLPFSQNKRRTYLIVSYKLSTSNCRSLNNDHVRMCGLRSQLSRRNSAPGSSGQFHWTQLNASDQMFTPEKIMYCHWSCPRAVWVTRRSAYIAHRDG